MAIPVSFRSPHRFAQSDFDVRPVADATWRAWFQVIPAAALLMTAAVQVMGASPAEDLLAHQRPLVIGHRGYSLFAPENTLASFGLALDAGVDLVELDYHHSADGVPIVIHDGTLDRTTDAVARWGGKNITVASRPAEALLGLDSGLWFKQPVSGLRLTTLGAALEFIQARGVTLIERKAGDAATLADLLRQRNLVNRVVVQAFDWTFLRDYRRLDPVQVLGALGPPGSRDGRKLTDEEKALSRAWLDEVKSLGVQAVVWNRQVDATSVRAAHEMGLKVWVYTINEQPLAQSLLDAGVDGIISDNPSLIWRAVATRPAGGR